MRKFPVPWKPRDLIQESDGGVFRVVSKPLWLRGIGWIIPTKVVRPPPGSTLKTRARFDLCQEGPEIMTGGREFQRIPASKCAAK